MCLLLEVVHYFQIMAFKCFFGPFQILGKAQNISTIDVPEGCTFPYSMMRWLTDESGTIMIDEILRLENIEEDVSGMCLKYDLKKPDITKSFSTKHLPYQCYFTEQWMIDWVAERNQDYIEHFGYEFA